MKLTPSLVAAGTLLLSASAAFGQSSATVSNVNATARIFKPITLTLSNDGLSFGDIFADAAGGTVTLDPQTDVRATTGPVLGTTGTVNSAAFAVSGKRNATYAITLPSSITLTGPGAPMPVGAFTAFPATGLLDGTGAQTFKVGATLTLGANQVDGDYSGTFNVTVAYN